ncbi:hypothetical protein LTR36_008346 [Oleoguttula mirabilis]|uniref:Tyrosinase copper-binding domain-containing protein n=1 Tax=Oleoguttula mirabilis TaxID=1507867 RepID=A0AAV9J8F3_9PEZI|nr:hypothetical protein LTR36_008346 [Oleoguttula mirabilis]
MWPLKVTKQLYEAVPNEEEEELKRVLTPPSTKSERKGPQRAASHRIIWISVLAVFFIAAVAMGIAVFTSSIPAHTAEDGVPGSQPSAASTDCPLRREWRTLTGEEQQSYISAVLCVRTQPSTLAPASNKTAYDDFPWIHSHVGYYTHNSAPFLPWHRYFLHIYESTLRESCGYRGSLVYWDWTLDSDALERSPVFDADTGFGGDGQVGGAITVGRSGRCVVDGPFAGVTADYYDVKYDPHCLSRGFRGLDGSLGHIDGHDISPESIEEVLSIASYEGFVTLMESRVHDAIPFGIGGDFETFTAPYGRDADVVVENDELTSDPDPLFFLHHTQLDRLWWLWQQRQPDKGLQAYGGHKQRHSMDLASLIDKISVQALASSVKVADLMDVQGELLCYHY